MIGETWSREVWGAAEYGGAMPAASDASAGAEAAWERAQALAAAGRVDDAYEILAVQSDEALPPAAIAFRSALREHMREHFAERFSLDVVLQPVALQDIRSLPLRAEDMFVFGLVRSEIALRDVLAICPLDEVDSLRVIAKLVDLGLVKQG